MVQETPPLDSVERLFDVVHTLDQLRGAGPSEVADHLNISKSTAHVYLRSLESTGYAVNDDGEYDLSHRFFSLGSRKRYRNRLYQATERELKSLAEETGEVALLMVEERGKSIVIEVEQGDRSFDTQIHPGMTFPLHSHVCGKIFLAHMSKGRRNKVLRHKELTPITEHTITDRATLENKLAKIKERGYAFDWDEQIIGMSGIGVPIFLDDALQGVIAISGPKGRIKDESYRNDLIKQIRGAVDSIVVTYKYGR